jgi:conjugative transposon TraM protein
MEGTLTSGKLPQHNPEFLRERKFLMMVPLLILPFLTMAFWALGGGKKDNNSFEATSVKGLNATLPQAQFKDRKEQDKMEVYQNEKSDSAGLADGGVSPSFVRSMGFDATVNRADSADKASTEAPFTRTTADASEAKIQAKLAQINHQLSQPQPADYSGGYSSGQQSGADVKRLEMMMKAMNSGGGGSDPEMKQLSEMLRQINDIQNPGNENSRLRDQSLKNRQRVYPVMAVNDDDGDSPDQRKVSFASYDGGSTNRHDTTRAASTEGNTIQAVVHEDQTLVSGAVVKLRLVDGIYVGGRMIPKGSFIYGTCALNNERLNIRITSIRYLNNILPVALSVYDLDGLEGLYVPGSIGRDAAKNGVSSAVQSMQLMTMDQSVGTQAASAGIEAAKGLFGRKVRQIKIKVKAGYEVLLKDTNNRDN